MNNERQHHFTLYLETAKGKMTDYVDYFQEQDYQVSM